MLLKLADHIRYAQKHAIDCVERAANANRIDIKDEWLLIERGWSALAELYVR